MEPIQSTLYSNKHSLQEGGAPEGGATVDGCACETPGVRRDALQAAMLVHQRAWSRRRNSPHETRRRRRTWCCACTRARCTGRRPLVCARCMCSGPSAVGRALLPKRETPVPPRQCIDEKTVFRYAWRRRACRVRHSILPTDVIMVQFARLSASSAPSRLRQRVCVV